MHISRLLNAISEAMNIPLPHPLIPFTSSGIDSMICPQFDLHSGFSLTPAFYMNDGVEYQDFSWMTLADIHREAAVDKSSPCHNTPSSNSSPKQDNKSEDDDVGDFNQLSPSIGSAEKEACFVINDSFEQAVTLLRADVVSLCLHCGMAPSSLRPSEAILLNLDELRRHLQGLCNSE